MSFDGFPEQALIFYEGLEADNTKAYWSDHKATYDNCVAAPMRSLLGELEPEFGPAKLFRPYRDVRFAKDKTPYKTQAAAVVRGDGEDSLYLALSADGLALGGGYHHLATDQSRRLRAAIADELTGPPVATVLDALRAASWEVGGEQLARIPKPWDDDHPRAGLLRNKSLTASRAHPPQAWLHTAAAMDRVAEGWRQLGPLNDWLRQQVGMSRTL